MAISFTQGNDFIVPTEDGQTYQGLGGDDTYIISAATVADNAEIIISDTEGANQIQLVGGLSITSSLVADNAVQLTLSNGAVVQILNADSFGYDVGGNALAGETGTEQTFTEFVEDTLGTTVPAEGEDPSEGGEAVISDDENTTPDAISLTDALAELQAAREAVTAQEDAIATFVEDAGSNDFVNEADGDDSDDVVEGDIADGHDAAADNLTDTADTTDSIADGGNAFNALTDAAQDARIETANADQQAAVDDAQDDVDDATDALESAVPDLVSTAATAAEALTDALDANDAAGVAADNSAAAAGVVTTGGTNATYTYDAATGVITVTSDDQNADGDEVLALTALTDGTVELVDGVTLNDETGNYEFTATDGDNGSDDDVDLSIPQAFLDGLVSDVQAAYDADAAVTDAEDALADAIVAVGEAQDDTWDGSAATYASLEGNGAIVLAGNDVTLDYSVAEDNDGGATITGGDDIDTYAEDLNTLTDAQDDQADFEDAVTEWTGTETLVDDLDTLNSDLDDLNDAADEALAAIENQTDDDPAGLGIDILEGAENFTAQDDVYLYDADDSDGQALTGFGTAGDDQIFIGSDFTLFTAAEDDEINDNLGDVSTLELIVIDDGTDTTLYFEGETFAGNSAGVDDIEATIELTGVTGGTAAIDADGFLTIA